MNKAEMLLAAKMLDMACEEFSNHGCGDFNLSEYMSDDEIVDFMTEHETWNVGGEYEDIDEDIRLSIETCDIERLQWTQDWIIMSALANKLEKEAEE